MKISIFGLGKVGSSVAFALVSKGIPDELILRNRTQAIAVGEAHDLTHSAAFTAHRMTIREGELSDTAGSDIIVLSFSVPMDKTIKSRSHLALGNAELFRQIVPEIARTSPDAVLIVVSNPVDALTYLTWKLSGFPRERVIGTGTLLDSARYRSLLSKAFNIHPDDIRAYILGEHGDSQFPALSLALTGGRRVDSSEKAKELFEETVRSGYTVVHSKGHSNYAIALAVVMIVESIARDDMRTMPVSTIIDGYCNVSDVCLSVPCVLGQGGICKTFEPNLSPEEEDAFRKSAQVVRQTIDLIGEA